tara:strand:+ start:115 stop:1398 length:1284 start_codon:yes stop_codon:yes gene_type:complete
MGFTGKKPSIIEAQNNNLPEGYMMRTKGNGGGTNPRYGYWRWNGTDDWEQVDKPAYDRWNADQIQKDEYFGDSEINSTIIEVGPLGGKLPSNDPKCYRWPDDTINTGTDYVFFQFGKYIPPFSRDADVLRTSSAQILAENEKDFEIGTRDTRDQIERGSSTAAVQTQYNASASQLDVTDEASIMLPMPQDLSTESNQQWQGKQFTATGRAAVAALAAGNFSFASSVVNNIAGNATAIQTALTSSVLNSIPGVGGNLEFNDISGSTRGVVINPNAELLYDAPEMREVGMIFRLVPRNYDESIEIREIVRMFRQASMPSWGSEDVDLVSGQKEQTGSFNFGDMNNWIHVPKLCKFTFMTGSKANKHIIQYKPCAISGVEVNYTPDGTWSSHTNPTSDNVMPGSPPTAVELRLNFMETKLIYADEVARGF